jgi:hypothetical protein
LLLSAFRPTKFDGDVLASNKWKAATNGAFGAIDVVPRNPITGIAGCCARAATGHAAAALPSSVMNWRRLLTRSSRMSAH